MSYIYKGFWSPTEEYKTKDLVRYYSSDGYNQTSDVYKCIADAPGKWRRRPNYPAGTLLRYQNFTWEADPGGLDAPNSEQNAWKRIDTAFHCPLKNFRYPVMNNEASIISAVEVLIQSNGQYRVVSFDGANEYDIQTNLTRADAQELARSNVYNFVYLNSQDLSSATTGSSGWSGSTYYSAGIWSGPNGPTNALEVSSLFWAKVDSLDPDYDSIVNAGWGDVNTYDTSSQEYGSTSLRTLVEGQYGSSDSSQEISFDEVQGETDADAYYISNVQNYQGEFEKSTEYQQFDVVRNPHSHLFCYARTDISQPDDFDNGDDLIFTNVTIKSPVENVQNARHVGTIELDQGSLQVNTAAASNLSQLKIGNVIDFTNSALTHSQNNQRFIVIGSSDSILYLGAYGSLDPSEFGMGSLMAHEPGVTFNAKRQSVEININSPDHDLWSTDQFFFDADYGSTVNFTAKNRHFDYGDGYQSVAPLGINSIRMEMDLKFSNRSNREANCIVHFLENNLGQHETDKQTHELRYDQGISGFRMDGDSLFFPYRNNENLIRRFYCFSYNHDVENEDVNSVQANIINTTASSLGVATQMFVTKAEAWSADEEYAQHSVVFCPENLKYYYSWSETRNRSFRPYLLESSTNNISGDTSARVTSINKHMWTREFYWKPSVPLSVEHNTAIKEYTSTASSYAQYFPEHKQNISNLSFELKFENRSDNEAYAILHFLESHLGYLSFLFVPPAPYNRKRRFYCESWQHTYVFKNNHTISASFKQFPLGQNTPLDDDEIDNIVPEEKTSPGRLSLDLDVDFEINKPENSEDLPLKKVISLKNIGDKKITISSCSLSNSEKFAKSPVGVYKNQISISGKTYIPDGSYSLKESSEGSVVYVGASNTYVHDSSGRVFADNIDGSGLQENLYQGIDSHVSEIIDEQLEIGAGEQRFVEIYFTAKSTDSTQALLTFEYYSDPAEEFLYEQNLTGINGEKYYLEGNLIQHQGEVWRVTTSFDSGASFSGDQSNLVKHETSVVSTIDAYVNRVQSDARKSALYINLNFPSNPIGASYSFNDYDFSDCVDFYRDKSGENFFKNIQANASHDSCEIALIELEEDFISVSGLPSLDVGLYLTRVYWDGLKYIDYDTIGAEVVDENGATVSAEKVIEGTIPNPGVTEVGFEWESNSVNNAPGVLLIHYPEGQLFELSDKKKIKLSIAPLGDLSNINLKGYIVQKNNLPSCESINLAQKISSSSEIGALELEDFSEVNVFISGDIYSSSTGRPALTFGGPWKEDVIINLYLGRAFWRNLSTGKIKNLSEVIRDGVNVSSDLSGYALTILPCNIKGAGGAGGNAMITEGEIYEAGQPVGSNENYIPAGKGQNGGDAMIIDGLEEDAQVNIYLLSKSSLRAGGGGGAGGAFNSPGSRIKTSGFVNFAGGGGGGAPMGASGGSGAKAGFNAGGGKGGEAINNDLNQKTHLCDGASGGNYGDSGESIMLGSEVILEGGLPGAAIKIEDGFIPVSYYKYDLSTGGAAQVNVTQLNGKDTLDLQCFSGEIIDV